MTVPSGRAALTARWLELTRTILPGMAAAQSWPISADHCFMRVCLDLACGAPWREIVRPPAIRTMPDELFAKAAALAEEIARHPDRLPELNEASLRLRRVSRRVSQVS